MIKELLAFIAGMILAFACMVFMCMVAFYGLG